jgi:ectoine hydroxylase-related dioxygenase (phytanoyl-CoA dioxygenase family)
VTPAERRRFERDGFLVVPDALSGIEVAELVDAVDGVWSRRRGAESPESDPNEPLHLLAFLGEDARFLALLDHPMTLPIVTDALGWNIFCYHCHLDVTPPVHGPRPAKWEWHQDGTRINRELEAPRPRLSVKVAYFLSDVSEPGRGNLRVLPGSHRHDTLDRPLNGGLEPSGAVPICVPPGAAVIFDRRLWHSRSDNRSNLTRKALFLAYAYRWIRPRDDLRIPPELMRSLSPIRRQLLGAGTGAIGHWLPADDDVPLRALVEPAGPSSLGG